MITYQELRKIQARERDEHDLQELGENFMEEVMEYVYTKRKALRDMKEKESVFSRDSVSEIQQELRNALAVLSDIYDRRQRKILSQVMIALKTDSLEDTSKMLQAENEMYEKALALLKSYRSRFLDSIVRGGSRSSASESKPSAAESKPSEPESQHQRTETIKKPQNEKMILLRTAHDVPLFVWQNGATYGPFSKGDVVSLPEGVAEILLNTSKAETIEADENEDAKKNE